jgi:hypothetical protein
MRDQDLAERIWIEAGQIFLRAAAEAERRVAADEVPPEPEPRPGVISTEIGTIRAITPGEVRRKRWIE